LNFKLLDKLEKNESIYLNYIFNFFKLLNRYLPFCGVSIIHGQLFDLYAYEYDRNKALLEVIHDLFEQQTNLDTIVFRIMQKAQTLLKCMRCSVLLILDQGDEVTSRKAFDLFQSGFRPGQRRHR
jgi:dual 3',5'-cyclic-AMP and -GMP phosphodiesterase 11